MSNFNLAFSNKSEESISAKMIEDMLEDHYRAINFLQQTVK